MRENKYNTKADKLYRKIAYLLITIMLACFVLIIVAFIKGYNWVMNQEKIIISLGEIFLESSLIAFILYLMSVLVLGSPKYVFFSFINNNYIKLIIYLPWYYVGIFLQSLAYFILGLPVAFIIIQLSWLSESNLFVILMFTLCIFSYLDTKFKLPHQFEKMFDKVVKKIQKEQFRHLPEPEEELNKIYNLERLYAIVATITTILVIGDAAASIAFPLKSDGENNYQAYLDSSSYIFMMIFVSATLVYLKELFKVGIKHKIAENDEFIS